MTNKNILLEDLLLVDMQNKALLEINKLTTAIGTDLSRYVQHVLNDADFELTGTKNSLELMEDRVSELKSLEHARRKVMQCKSIEELYKITVI